MRFLTRLSLVIALLGVAQLDTGCGKGGKLPTYDAETLAVDPSANFVLGVHTLRNPDKNGVIDYSKAYEYFVNSATLGGGPKAHFNAGWVAEIIQRPEDAERHYGAAYEADKTYRESLFSYARVLSENGKATQGVAIYRDFLSTHLDDLEVRNELVNALGNGGMYDEAIVEAKEILLRDPNNAQVYRNLSAMYYANEDFGMSQLCNEKALALEEGDGGTYNNMGVTYLLQGDESKAIEAFKTAIKLDPDNYEANTNLGFIALDSGDYGLAFDTLSKAVEANPTSLDAKLGLAVAYRGRKDYDQAGKLYDEIIKTDPSNGTAYFNAAILHEKYTHDFTKSLKYLEAYVNAMSGSVGPGHEVFARMERVKKSKEEEEARKAAEEAKIKEAEEREARNRELLESLKADMTAFSAKIDTIRSCEGQEENVMELEAFAETAQMVIESEDVSMAPDIKSMLDDYYAGIVDTLIAECAGGGTPEDGGEPLPEEDGSLPEDGGDAPEGGTPEDGGDEAPE